MTQNETAHNEQSDKTCGGRDTSCVAMNSSRPDRCAGDWMEVSSFFLSTFSVKKIVHVKV